MSCEYVDHYYEWAYEQLFEELERSPTDEEWEERFQLLVDRADAMFDKHAYAEEENE